MSEESELIAKLTTLNDIAETLNRAADVRGVLNQTLARLVELMGLETAWIFLKDAEAEDGWWGPGFTLAAHHNLPPALGLDRPEAWNKGCDCQTLCSGEACAHEAYNQMSCSRLLGVQGDRRGLAMHASAPLRSGERTLGILNVAAPNWASFSPQSLALLSNVGNQLGIALERARLFDLVQERRLEEQAILLSLSQQLLSRRGLGDLIDSLVEQVRQVVEADACAILLPGTGAGSLDFRAASGWREDPVVAGRQAPADERSIPGRVMGTQQSLLVEDLEGQALAVWMPGWMREEGFRGQAAVPLVADGRSVGVLVVHTRQPHRFAEDEMRLLHLMANQAAMAIERARFHQEEVRIQSLEKELAVGRQIQLSLLPRSLPELPGWEFAAFYRAAREVGGDFYDFFELPGEPGWDEGGLGIVIGDVTGKGVPAALFMTRSATILRTVARDVRSPSAVLARANALIVGDSPAALLLSALYVTLDPGSGRLVYANAGHNPPLWRQAATGQVQELNARGILLGAFGEAELRQHGIVLQEGEVEMEPGDVLLLYTDGATEAMDAEHSQFGPERLHATVAAQAGASAQQMVDAVVRAVQVHGGDGPQWDDIALFAIRRCP